MREPIHLLVFAIGLALFILAATPWIPEPLRLRLVSAGLACWALSTVITV